MTEVSGSFVSTGTISVAPAGPSATFTATVSGIDGTGGLRLDLVDNGSIADLASTALAGGFTTGEIYDIDNEPPTAPGVDTSGTTPTNDTTPTWTWTAGSGGAGYFRYGFAVGTWIAEDVTDTSYTPVSDLAEGGHTLYVQERDDMNNWSDAGALTIVVDTTAPDAPFVTGPTSTADATPTWTWAPTGGGGNGRFRYGHTLGNWIAEDVTDTFHTPAAALPDGEHVLYVQERDDAGNWSLPGSFPITITLTTGDGGCTATGGGSGPWALLLPLGFLPLLLRRRGAALV